MQYVLRVAQVAAVRYQSFFCWQVPAFRDAQTPNLLFSKNTETSRLSKIVIFQLVMHSNRWRIIWSKLPILNEGKFINHKILNQTIRLVTHMYSHVNELVHLPTAKCFERTRCCERLIEQIGAVATVGCINVKSALFLYFSEIELSGRLTSISD